LLSIVAGQAATSGGAMESPGGAAASRTAHVARRPGRAGDGAGDNIPPRWNGIERSGDPAADLDQALAAV
jgi:hypothetical protein